MHSLLTYSKYESLLRSGTEARQLRVEAHIVAKHPATWADHLPQEPLYGRHTLAQGQLIDNIFRQISHVCSTARLARMGNRYRALRLTINGRLFNCISMSCDPSESDLQSLKERALSQTAHLSDNLCSSIPYFLGFVRTKAGNGHHTRITTRPQVSQRCR